MKRKTKQKLLIAGLVLTASAAVAGISYAVSANQKGLDETNAAIKDIIGERYSFVTADGTKQFKQESTLEKMYITNEANLAVEEYATEKAYRSATYELIITDDCTEEDYLKENEDVKVFTLENVDLKAGEDFVIKNFFDGDILEIENKELTISDHFSSESVNTVSVNYDSRLEVTEKGIYDFYLITSEETIELIVNYTAAAE